ncbi:MAG: HD family phosphohydrolase [Phycisphaerales bacterium]
MAEKTGPISRRESVAAKLRKRGGRRWLVLKEPIVMRDLLAHPAFLPVAGIVCLFVLVTAAIAWTARGGLTIAPGRIMDDTRVVRVEFSDVDEDQTRAQRDLKRTLAPRVYRADEKLLEEVENSIRGLPALLVGVGSIEKVDEAVARAFRLMPERFDAIKAQTSEGQPSQTWLARTDILMTLLRRTALISAEEYQAALRDGTERLELRSGGSGKVVPESVGKFEAMSVGSSERDMRAKVRKKYESIVREAGFTEAGRDIGAMIADRLEEIDRPIFEFDASGTEERRAEAAAAVPPVRVTHRAGEVIHQRGERLGAEAFALAHREHREYRSRVPVTTAAIAGAGMAGVAALLAGALGGYIGVFYRRLATSPWWLAALAALICATFALATHGTLAYPSVLWFTSMAPTVMLALICVIAYDRRLVLAVAGSQALLVALAVELPVSQVIVTMVGVGAVAWQFNDLRHRSDVVRGGLVVAAALGLSVLVASLLERPMVPGIWSEVIRDAAWGTAAGFLPAVLTLALLPSIERVFDVTTGMTLSELRDPKHPLLRQLQTRAPGTFNHCQTVAVLAESAAEAVGADGLHVYVGALYHDIGKMNKPEYFVENQQGGVSRHSRLSPAMSLLVIVGHVKDGVELAREYRLPQSLHHYIESHHGTTLVEYFYDAARRQAEDDERTEPSELEYRYPGPKPRTREAAILMLCDAVESATRAMPEPTPARISTLVHSMAAKRLADGQFDECDLNLREINRIESAIVKSLCSLYHSRIAYPRGEEEIVSDARRVAIERSA